MANENKITMEYVKGVSKKNGYAYYACRVTFPTYNGRGLTKMIFFKDLEMQLMGLDENAFKPMDQQHA